MVERSLELYTCSGRASDVSEMPGADSNATSFQNYNELATLMSVTGERISIFKMLATLMPVTGERTLYLKPRDCNKPQTTVTTTMQRHS